jgi:ATP-binding cassette, subfamily F, member 3
MQQFQGTLVFISHDVYFIRAIARNVIHVKGGELNRYPDDYDYYLEKTKAESARAGLTAGNAPVRTSKTEAANDSGLSRKDQKRAEAEERQARSRERKAIQDHVAKLEKEIQRLEKRQTELAAELEDPKTYEPNGRAMQINRELSEVTDALHARTAEWEAEATRLAAFNGGVTA